jgi:hypothetical protein
LRADGEATAAGQAISVRGLRMSHGSYEAVRGSYLGIAAAWGLAAGLVVVWSFTWSPARQ